MRTGIISFLLAAMLVAMVKSKPFVSVQKKNFHIYLSFGKYHKGTVIETKKDCLNRFKVISTVYDKCKGRTLGKWYPAIPQSNDCDCSLGAVDFFGSTLVEQLPDVTVGVVPVSLVNNEVNIFEECYQIITSGTVYQGDNAFLRLLNSIKKAREDGILKAIIINQSEFGNVHTSWIDHVKVVYERILSELNLTAEQVPLIVDGVTIPSAHVVSVEDLGLQNGRIQYSTQTCRVLGDRYAKVMLKILKANNNASQADPVVVAPVDPADVSATTEVVADVSATTEVVAEASATTEVVDEASATTEVVDEAPVTTEVVDEAPVTTEVADEASTEPVVKASNETDAEVITEGVDEASTEPVADETETDVFDDEVETTDVFDDEVETTDVLEDEVETTPVDSGKKGKPVSNEGTKIEDVVVDEVESELPDLASDSDSDSESEDEDETK